MRVHVHMHVCVKGDLGGRGLMGFIQQIFNKYLLSAYSMLWVVLNPEDAIVMMINTYCSK